MAELYDQSRNDALQRLNQTLLQIDPYILPPYPNLSLVSGPLNPPLLQLTLSQLLRQQVDLYPNNEAVVIPWTGTRWTYQKLWEESSLLARALLKEGVRPRDRIGIMSGNCEKYIALFFACARVGAICVTLNNTYTATEMEYALKHTSTSSDLSWGRRYAYESRVSDTVYHTYHCALRQRTITGKTKPGRPSIDVTRPEDRMPDTRSTHQLY
jgi:non-ribosomal peptide synthetase component E (peptide arylation enzyme)